MFHLRAVPLPEALPPLWQQGVIDISWGRPVTSARGTAYSALRTAEGTGGSEEWTAEKRPEPWCVRSVCAF